MVLFLSMNEEVDMESPICFELSFGAFWKNDSRIEAIQSVQQCLSVLSVLYVGVQNTKSVIFHFQLLEVSRSLTAGEIYAVPQIAIQEDRLQICLRHKKQIATLAIPDTIDVSILATAMFYYLEYYADRYQFLRDRQAKMSKERLGLADRVEEEKQNVALLQQRDLFEDDEILSEALNHLHIAEDRYKQNGMNIFETNKSLGRLFRFQEV
jgi:hypothetical protein